MVKIIGINDKLYKNTKTIPYIDFAHFANSCKNEMSKDISFNKKKDYDLFRSTTFDEEISGGIIKLLDRIFPFLVTLLAVFLAVFPVIIENDIAMISVESIFGFLSIVVLGCWLKVIRLEKHMEIDPFTNLRSLYARSKNASEETHKFSLIILIDEHNYDRKELITLLRRISHNALDEQNFNVFIESKTYEKEILSIFQEILNTHISFLQESTHIKK